MAVRIQLRRDTAANWSSTNPVLNNGEPGFDTTNKILKIGDGVTAWNNLDNKFATDAQGTLADSALQPGDIGVTVQGYSADTVIDANYVATENSYTTTEKNKLAGIEAGATANDTDANLLSRANHTGTQTASTISDFDTEVSNNTDVAANTSARHDAVTVVDSSEIDFTLTGQQITASIVAGSIDESKLDASVNASLNKADAGREVLTANRTYYVRTDGNDSNDGLANTPGGAFLTLQKALNIAATLDLSIYDVTIQLANGTYAGGTAKSAVGHGKIIIIGDTVNPSNVVVNNQLVVSRCTTVIEIQGLAMTSSGYCLHVIGISTVHISGNCHFFAAQRDIYIEEGTVKVFSSYRVDSGTRLIHVSCLNNGVYSFGTLGIVITMDGTPSFTDSTFNASTAGVVNIPVGRGSFSGAATGVRYRAAGNAVINASGGGTSFIPGDAAGILTTGGQYV